MKYFTLPFLLLFLAGCQDLDLKIPDLSNPFNSTEINELKIVHDPYDKIKSFTTQERIGILTKHFMEKNYHITKPVLPIKPEKPAIPIIQVLEKGEFELSKEFKKRILKGNLERKKQINQLGKVYKQKVERYNKEIKKLTDNYNSKILRIKENESELLSQATAKALSTIYGKPQLQDLKYDADNERFFGTVVSTRNDFKEKVTIEIPIKYARNFKLNSYKIRPQIIFELLNNKLLLKRLDIPFEKKIYEAILTDVKYNPETIKVAINKGNLDLEKANFIKNDFKIANSNYQLTQYDFSIDPEIAKMQKRKLELREQSRKKSLKEEKILELARLKKELQKEIATYEKKVGGHDDIPDLLAKTKQVKIDNKKWLIIIAIEDYEVTTSVNFAKNSALRFKQVAKKTLGIPENNIRTLVNATSGNIKRNLKSMLRQVEKDDTIYFYYSGHGIPVASQHNEPYILPKDMSPDYIQDEDFFRLQNIYTSLTNSHASKVIAFTDSCFSGVTDNKSVLREGLGATRLKPRNVIFDSKKMVILTAGTGKQYSNMYKKKSHRLFSYFVMRSLLKGKKTIKSLHSDIYKNVKRESYKLGSLYEQNPTIEGNKGIKL